MICFIFPSFGLIVNPSFTSFDQVQIADITSADSIQMQILDFNFTLNKAPSSPLYSFNGTDFSTEQQDDCFYTTSDASAFHICNGIHGTFVSENGTGYKISPVITNECQIADISSNHELTEQLIPQDSFCGVYNISFITPLKRRLEKRILNDASSTNPRVVDILLFIDYSFYADRGQNAPIDAQNFLNGANQIYAMNMFNEPISLNVTAMVMLTSDLLILNSNNLMTDFLPLFYEYTQELATQNPTIHYLTNPDVSFMLSHKLTMPPTTVGLAYVGGACGSPNSGIASRLGGELDSWVNLVVAHEIGHLLGASHDGTHNNCPNTGNIMAPFISSSNPIDINQFSTCSKSYLNAFISTIGHECLIQQSISTTQICGNGFVDPGEEFLIY